MLQQISLESFLAGWAGGSADEHAVVETILSIAEAATELSERIGIGPIAPSSALTAAVGGGGGDLQVALDVVAHERIVESLRSAPVALVGSEELAAPLALNGGAPLAVAIDPLDGSSNIDLNISVGTIFSILPMPPRDAHGVVHDDVFMSPGRRQKAAGYVIYGPQCALVLTVGTGTHVFTLDRTSGTFRLTRPTVTVPRRAREYAINGSNERHWEEPVRTYVAECRDGRAGPRGEDYNTRWVASLVAECHRILLRGGVFLYPRDARKGYEHGRLRLVYEASPIAWLIEEAGGEATDGLDPILDLEPTSLHQRTPFVFGSAEEVAHIAALHRSYRQPEEQHQLFSSRGLLRG